MSAALRLLERLDGVQETRPGRWRARCPAHGSRGRSVAVAEMDDRVLVHAFCGCETDSVLAAVGLTVADLFDNAPQPAPAGRRAAWSARDLLDLVLREAHALAIVGARVVERQRVDDDEWQRIAVATSRLSEIARIAGS